MTATKMLLCGLCALAMANLAAQSNSKLELVLTALEQDPDFQHASFSFYALDIAQNKVVAQRNPNLSLVPASSLKVITTSSALALLGNDFTFKTELQHDGVIKQGTLYGNLYIKGYGDPTLGSPHMPNVANTADLLQQWALMVKRAGIQRIEGAVVGDGSYFDNELAPQTWQWGDIGNYYGAGVSGLNLHDNEYTVVFQQPNKAKQAATIKRTAPDLSYLEFDNHVVSAEKGTGDQVNIYAAPYASAVTLRGTIPAGAGEFRVKGAIPDPSQFAATAMAAELERQGISISKKPITNRQLKANEPRRTIYTHESPTLLDIVKHTNEDSRNLYCEAMVKAIGVRKRGAGSFSAGLEAIQEFWTERGVDMKGFFMHDGSGLSPRNSISTKSFAQIMRKIYVDKPSFGSFYNTLAIAGSTGTLSNVGRNSAAANNIRAKSGSINRVRSYTGYVTTATGKLLAFSMIVNNYSCSGTVARRKLEEILIQMAELNY